MVLFIFSRSLKSIAVLRLTKIVKITTEAFFQEVFRKKLFLEIRKIYRKTPVPRVFFNKVAGLRPETLLKNRL